jgi:hypothetical protein
MAMSDDQKNPAGWPGAPGVPLHPERDGWHWLRYYNDAEPRLRLWDASGGTGWAFGPPHADPGVVTYLEPALTPAEVAARRGGAGGWDARGGGDCARPLGKPGMRRTRAWR